MISKLKQKHIKGVSKIGVGESIEQNSLQNFEQKYIKSEKTPDFDPSLAENGISYLLQFS